MIELELGLEAGLLVLEAVLFLLHPLLAGLSRCGFRQLCLGRPDSVSLSGSDLCLASCYYLKSTLVDNF